MIIDDKIYRLITREGFIKEFWADLRACRTEREDCTRRGIYERLEALYEKQFGERKFPSYESFVKFLNRSRK